MIRLRRIGATASVDGEYVNFQNGAGRIVARCKKAKSAEAGSYSAVYALYFDLTSGCLFRIAHIVEAESPTILGSEVIPRALRALKDDQVQLLIEAALVGERHEYRRTKPGGMDQLFEVIDIAVADFG